MERGHAQRTVSIPTFASLALDGDLKARRLEPPRQKSRRSLPRARPVETRSQTQEQFGLTRKRRRFALTRLELNALYEAQHSQMPPRHPFRIRHAITAQPLPEIFRLSNI